MPAKRPVTIVIADDDEDDRLLIIEAFKEFRLTNPIVEVVDGEELLDYLNNRGKFAGKNEPALPGLILLDLNMPRMDGREALKEIKGHPDLRRIPVVVLTTSKAEEDIIRSYDIGANSFIVKPVNAERFIEVVRSLQRYWLEIVEMPHEQ